MQMKKTSIFLLVLIVGIAAMAGIGRAEEDENPPVGTIFLPQIYAIQPPSTITDAWLTDQSAIRSDTFAPGEIVTYQIRGNNPRNWPVEVNFSWQQVGDCGESQLYEQTLTLPAGDWVYQYDGVALDCLGAYDNTVTITADDFTDTLSTQGKVVDTSSDIITRQAVHGFEKCGLPSIEKMQTWAQESPYTVFNIYLGGDHFACKLLIDADWVRATAAQGWEFILTWAGHGTSCWEAGKDNYHPISSKPAVAYQEGRDAAEEAIGAARSLGFLGQKIIYYDVEGYTNDENSVCSKSMQAFLEGWAARLQENGDKAGAYGSPCRSYILDWWTNDPLLDDIWFARWSYEEYTEGVTVDDSGSCALPDKVWPGRRIRQYAGDHNEEWPACPAENCTAINGITSNVIYGEITRLLIGE
jgi:hypothetical protein